MTVEKQDADEILFAPVSLTTLVDSPVLAGENFRSIALAPDVQPPHHLNIAADSVAALAISDRQIAAYSRLVREAGALFGARHYDHYDFLVSLTNYFYPNGLEHHQSSDERIPERTFINSDQEESSNSLLSHEFTHSWNGKYRRPAGLATPDFEQPMKDDLLWIYEGLTQDIGEFLSARAGLRTPDDYRESLARVAAYLDTPGRSWRTLEDTAVSAQLLYDVPGRNWAAWRRSVDFYDEGWLVWLDADTLIRQQSHGQKSLDDFCKRFYGAPDSSPKVVPYTLDDVIAALNAVAPYDWRGFFNARVYEINPHPPLGGIERGGWQLVYNDQENAVDAGTRKYERESRSQLLPGDDRANGKRRRKRAIGRRHTREARGGGGPRSGYASGYRQRPRIHLRRAPRSDRRGKRHQQAHRHHRRQWRFLAYL